MALLRGKTILIVEDEALIALDLEVTLTSEGAQVITSPALDHAFKVAQKHAEISAAILDVQLGEKDCAPLCQMLELRQVPFIFHTGYGAGGVLDQWPQAPVLTKPSTKEQLLNCLTGALNGSREALDLSK